MMLLLEKSGKELLASIRQDCLDRVSQSPEQARRFFKKNNGNWGNNDFLGVATPQLRLIALKYSHVDLEHIKKLLASPYNEERLIALFIVVHNYQKSSPDQQKNLCDFYLENLIFVNSWNLVDSSAYQLLGHYLWDKERSILKRLAASEYAWERRVAIVATLYFIKKNDVSTTFEIAQLLLHDTDDLIHKATGWMLREAGKKDEAALVAFLAQHKRTMPKIMVRYAQERLAKNKRVDFLS